VNVYCCALALEVALVDIVVLSFRLVREHLLHLALSLAPAAAAVAKVGTAVAKVGTAAPAVLEDRKPLGYAHPIPLYLYYH